MKRCHSLLGAHTQGPGYDGVLLDSLPSPDPRTSTPARATGRTWTHTTIERIDRRCACC
jgi:hypothetical protein